MDSARQTNVRGSPSAASASPNVPFPHPATACASPAPAFGILEASYATMDRRTRYGPTSKRFVCPGLAAYTRPARPVRELNACSMNPHGILDDFCAGGISGAYLPNFQRATCGVSTPDAVVRET